MAHYRSRHLDVFRKQGALKNTCARVFFNKVADFADFAKFFESSFVIGHFRWLFLMLVIFNN